jgi:hypothetical protein
MKLVVIGKMYRPLEPAVVGLQIADMENLGA